jgi:hypothetical protein
MRLSFALLATVSAFGSVAADQPSSLADWAPAPAGWKGAQVRDSTAVLTSDRWSYLLAPRESADVEVSATVIRCS